MPMVSPAAAIASTLLGPLLLGCMAPPEAEELVLAEAEPLDPGELFTIPEGAPEPPVAEPEEPPPPSVVDEGPGDRPRFVLAPEREGCPVVSTEGFPAISLDGSQVVVPRAFHEQLSMTPGSLELQWHDVALGSVVRSEPVVTDELVLDDDARCEPAATLAVTRRAEQRNRELAAGRWRSLEELPLEYFDPSSHIIEAYREEHPPGERGPQVIQQHGELVLRIVGARVLERHPVAPHVHGTPFRVFGDRQTGTVVVVSVGCAGDSCTCDPSVTAQVMHWSPETFAAIERRPCKGEGGYCEPIDYDYPFEGVGGAWSI